MKKIALLLTMLVVSGNAFADCKILLSERMELSTADFLIENLKESSVSWLLGTDANLGLDMDLKIVNTGRKDPFGNDIKDLLYRFFIYRNGVIYAQTEYLERDAARKLILEDLKIFGCH